MLHLPRSGGRSRIGHVVLEGDIRVSRRAVRHLASRGARAAASPGGAIWWPPASCALIASRPQEVTVAPELGGEFSKVQRPVRRSEVGVPFGGGEHSGHGQGRGHSGRSWGASWCQVTTTKGIWGAIVGCIGRCCVRAVS